MRKEAVDEFGLKGGAKGGGMKFDSNFVFGVYSERSSEWQWFGPETV